ncbi:DUF6603 domain-containing protein [Marinomonas transparens]|uniref:DUF6603 domain-containing protein n=1 Tax=Marinomonas transparens TaxID=2795388 RepID=A0A934JI43_9GAMM|nr:DUF6603 domain-containing protein [Marinomonas transparens]MBJ7536460.1 hypothetical protein [Marinomonas transparens]
MTSLQTIYQGFPQATELTLSELMSASQLSNIQSLLKGNSLQFSGVQNATFSDNLLAFEATFFAFGESAQAKVYVLDTSNATQKQDVFISLTFANLSPATVLDAYTIALPTGSTAIASPIDVSLKSQTLLYSTLTDVSAYTTELQDFLSASTIAAKDIKAGFNFDISATPVGVLDTALGLLGYTSVALDMTGYLTMGFRPTFETVFDLNLTTPTYDGLALTLSTLSLSWDLTLKELYTPQIGIDGTIKMGATSASYRAGLDLDNHQLYLNFKHLPSFGDLATALDIPAIESLSTHWPSDFKTVVSDVEKLELQKLGVLIDLQGKNWLQAWFTLTTTTALELLENKVSILPNIKVKASHNTTASPVTTTLTADIDGVWSIDVPAIGNTPAKTSYFDTSVTLPALDFSVGLAVGSSFSLQCFQAVFGASPFFQVIEGIDLLTMSVQGNFTDKSLSVQVASTTNWSIHYDGLSLAISNLGFSMDYSSGALQNLALSGSGEIEGIYFSVNASHNDQGWALKGTGYMASDFSFSQWIQSWPGGDIPSTELAQLTSVIPLFSMKGISFSYDQPTKALQMQATVDLVVSATLSATPLAFKLSAARSEDSDKKLAWTLNGNSQFAAPISLVSVMNSVINTFGISDSIPASITGLDLSISALSFSYNTVSAEFDFGFTLDKPAAFSGITGNDISTDKSSPHSFTTFHVTRTKTEQDTKTVLTIKINAGLQLEELLDLQGDLPTTLNPTLDDIDFSLALENSKDGDKASTSTDFSFSTTFTDSGHQFEFSGAFNELTQGTTKTKLFGGNIHSPSGGTLDMGDSFPINLDLKDVFIAKVSVTEVSKTAATFSIFGSDLTIDADFNLSTLPVVGSFLTEAKFAFNALRFTYLKPKSPENTPPGISADELKTVNTFLQEINVAPLVTAQSSANNKNGDKTNFPSGYSLQGSLILGDNAMTIPLHTSFATTNKDKAPSKGSGSDTPPSPSTSTSPSTASPVGKKFGPVTIDSVGLGMRDGGIGLKFTGGLTIGPVEFDLIGFEITTPISHFDPDITIEGLGLDIKKGALSLQGLMMEGDIDIPAMDYSTGKVVTEKIKAYSGALTVDYKQYNLAALGSYAQLPDGSPTMFLYAFLGAPLGGIPAFFVTGVAAGFGYNRTFNMPAPTEISSFPLIQPVIGSPPAGSLSDNFAAMNKDFLPKEGAFWGAIGIRVESFKMVESFVLLDVQFGDTLEVDLLGISNMTFPTPAEGDATHPLAKIIIGIEARMRPEQGILTIDGAFQPGTYIFNPNAHLSGGFGMLSIFSDQTSGTYKGAKEGAFICSIGGYPSGYPIKSYYPQPQRIALNWQINQVHSIKGEGYFAIVPEAMMAGGSFANLYHIGGPFDISASFILGADFIIYWKPYHYKAGVSLEIDVRAAINVDLWLVSIHLDFNMDLGADLQVWGPPFAGKGYLTVHAVVTFSVDVSFGDVNPAPIPIDWSEFSNSFLPETDKMLTAAVGSGLLSTVEQTVSGKTTKIDVVNPKEVSLVCHTAFPLKSVATSTNVAIGGTSATDFGIAPMAKTSDDVKSTLTVTVTKNSTSVETDFTYKVLTQNLPSAMWQAADKEGSLPNTQGKDLIPDLACGIEITPKPQAPETPFTITEPEEEVISMPNADVISAFTYEASNFSMIA